MNRISKPNSRTARRHSIAALGALVALTAAGCGSGSDPPEADGSPAPSRSAADVGSESPAAKTEIRLQQIAASTSQPIYYLGDTFNNWPLHDAVIFSGGSGVDGATSLESGQTLSIGYGYSCSGDTCSWKLEVTTQPVSLTGAVGCSRLRSLRGVPTVQWSDAVLLFTGDRAVRLGGTASHPKVAKAAAQALRLVGEDASSGSPLTPPDASALPIIDTACGRHPGDRGPGIEY